MNKIITISVQKKRSMLGGTPSIYKLLINLNNVTDIEIYEKTITFNMNYAIGSYTQGSLTVTKETCINFEEVKLSIKNT